MLKEVPRRIAVGLAALVVLSSCTDSPTATMSPAEDSAGGVIGLAPTMSNDVVESEVQISEDENGDEEGLEVIPPAPEDPLDLTTFTPFFDMREVPEFAEASIGFETDVKVQSFDNSIPTYRVVYYPAYVPGKGTYDVLVATGKATRSEVDWAVPVVATAAKVPLGTTKIVMYVTNSNGRSDVTKFVQIVPRRARWSSSVDFLPDTVMVGDELSPDLKLSKAAHVGATDYTVALKVTWGDGRVTTKNWQIEEDKTSPTLTLPTTAWTEAGVYTVQFEVSGSKPSYKSVHKEKITVLPNPDFIKIWDFDAPPRPRAGDTYTITFHPNGAAAQGLLDVRTYMTDSTIFTSAQPGQPASFDMVWPERPGQNTQMTIVSGIVNGTLMADTLTWSADVRVHPVITNAQVPDTVFVGQEVPVSFGVIDPNFNVESRSWLVGWIPQGGIPLFWRDTNSITADFETATTEVSVAHAFTEPGEYEIWLVVDAMLTRDGGMVTRQMHPVTVIMPCEPGSFASGATCEPAPPGTYVAEMGATEPTPCAVGTYQFSSGQTSCHPAPPGSFVSVTGATMSKPCPAGTFQPAAGATRCIPAPTGSYVAHTGATAAELCAPGTFQSESGATTCERAPAGSYVSDPGAFAPRKCSPGTYQDSPGQTSCIPAPPGSFVSVIGAKSAQQCVPGTFQASSGMTSCDPAPAGSFVAGAGASAATPCAAGTFQAAPGMTSCNPAPAGSFVAGIGATAATQCAAGTFQGESGMTSCVPAPAGSYVAGIGATASTPCALGTYQNLSGQVSCVPAPVGSYVDVIGAAQATPCSGVTSTMQAGSTSAADCLFVGTVAENRMDEAIQSGELAPAQPGRNGQNQFDRWVDGVKRSVKFLQGPQHQAGCTGIRNAVRDLDGGGSPKPKVQGPASKKTAEDLEWVRDRNSC